MAGLKDIWPPALEAARHALFLDLDGTLVEIANDPAHVRMDDAMVDMLRAFGRVGAVAVLTGRRIVDADRILGGAVGAIAGLHGLERRLAADHGIDSPSSLAAMRHAANTFQSAIDRGELDARLEDKGASIALHYRHAPGQGTTIRDLVEAVAREEGLRALPGKMVVELLPPGPEKGAALRAFMQAPPFAGRKPVMVGDDVTDESAFDAANALGGVSVLVGPARDTAARHRLENVADVRAWLSHALEAAR